ncbi:MAG: hypothetical protein ACK44Q_09505 [Pirellulaceae bacterium]
MDSVIVRPFEYEYRFTEYEYRFTEYEYRFTEYEYRFTEYEYRFTEYEEIGSEVRCSCYWVEEVLRALREPRRNVPDGARKSRAADSSSAGIHPGGVRIDRIHRWVRPGKANRRLAVFRWNPSVLSFITIW